MKRSEREFRRKILFENNKLQYIPITPGGTVLLELAAETEDGAWTNLINDASHMPYKTKQNFINRGYTIGKLKD